jgi:hypothetical protein
VKEPEGCEKKREGWNQRVTARGERVENTVLAVAGAGVRGWEGGGKREGVSRLFRAGTKESRMTNAKRARGQPDL